VLWAGWRMPYIRKAGTQSKASPGCLFCSMGRVRPGRRNLVLARTGRALVVLNRYPYNVGHVMVAPLRHVRSLSRLTPDESLEIADWLGRMERALERAYEPHGLNVGLNLGRVAGAGVLGHLHWHVVPRWTGDTNFMPATAGTKVLPEALDRTYERLARALGRVRKPGD
jgi:ATP adenylyltransferase